MLVAENITKFYGKQLVLNNINLTINAADFTVIMGPSGSGKSTLLNILAAIDTATQGRIIFEQQELFQLSTKKIDTLRQKNMSFIFQEYHLLNTLTCKENIALPLTIQKQQQHEISQKILQIAETLSIRDILSKYPNTISGGEKQRVAVARALITHPKIIFADEPTGALDSKNAYELLKILEKSNAEDKQTIVLVTHDPFTASFAKKILFIKDGNIYHTLERGTLNRKSFFEQIIQMTSMMGGNYNVI